MLEIIDFFLYSKVFALGNEDSPHLSETHRILPLSDTSKANSGMVFRNLTTHETLASSKLKTFLVVCVFAGFVS